VVADAQSRGDCESGNDLPVSQHRREFFADEESWQSLRQLASAVRPAARPSRPFLVLLLWAAIVIAVILLWTLFNRT